MAKVDNLVVQAERFAKVFVALQIPDLVVQQL